MSVNCKFSGNLAVVTLDRPEVFNALDLTAVEKLAQMYREIAALEQIDIVVLQTEGKGFCAGGDLGFAAANIDDLEPAVHRFLDQSDALLHTMMSMRQLTVSLVHGAAAGAGVSLAAASDLCFGSENAVFHPAYLALGVPPDLGGSLSVPRRIGTQRAVSFFLMETPLGSEQALEWGLLDELVLAGNFREAAMERITRLANREPQALSSMKSLLRPYCEENLSAALSEERVRLIEAMSRPRFWRTCGASCEAPCPDLGPTLSQRMLVRHRRLAES